VIQAVDGGCQHVAVLRALAEWDPLREKGRHLLDWTKILDWVLDAEPGLFLRGDAAELFAARGREWMLVVCMNVVGYDERALLAAARRSKSDHLLLVFMATQWRTLRRNRRLLKKGRPSDRRRIPCRTHAENCTTACVRRRSRKREAVLLEGYQTRARVRIGHWPESVLDVVWDAYVADGDSRLMCFVVEHGMNTRHKHWCLVAGRRMLDAGNVSLRSFPLILFAKELWTEAGFAAVVGAYASARKIYDVFALLDRARSMSMHGSSIVHLASLIREGMIAAAIIPESLLMDNSTTTTTVLETVLRAFADVGNTREMLAMAVKMCYARPALCVASAWDAARAGHLRVEDFPRTIFENALFLAVMPDGLYDPQDACVRWLLDKGYHIDISSIMWGNHNLYRAVRAGYMHKDRLAYCSNASSRVRTAYETAIERARCSDGDVFRGDAEMARWMLEHTDVHVSNTDWSPNRKRGVARAGLWFAGDICYHCTVHSPGHEGLCPDHADVVITMLVDSYLDRDTASVVLDILRAKT